MPSPKINFNVPPLEKVTMADAVGYMNCVIAAYGPPCDFCEHFSLICGKGHRPRKYDMELGPYAEWTIRKLCSDFSDGEENQEQSKTGIRKALDCFVQQYCS